VTALQRALPIIAVPILFCATGIATAGANATLYGTWQFNKAESTDIVAWQGRRLRLEIRTLGDAVTIEHDWRHRGDGSWRESLTIRPGGEPVVDLVESPIWPANWYMGVLAAVGTERITTASWLEPGQRLITETEQVVEVSQGRAVVVTTRVYAVDRQADRLTLTETRSTRPTPVTLVFDRVAEDAHE
jgi:hypothetical protein